MKTRISKVSIVLLSSLFLVLATIKTILACSGSDTYDNRDFSVFTPEIIHQPEAVPFFLSYHSYYWKEGYEIPVTAPTLTERNTDEWLGYFGNRLKKEDVEWLIYQSRLTLLDSLKDALEDPKEPARLTEDNRVNKIVLNELLKQKEGAAILDYIIIAKQGEKYYNPDYDAWEPLKYDSSGIQAILSASKEGYRKASDPFIKRRYAFQVVRSLSLMGQYAASILFFDNAFKVPSGDGIYYRSLGYKARSLYKLQRYSESNYYYAFLFDNDPCNKYLAYQSFHPQEEADWNATLTLARTTATKTALWELLGLYADPIRAIKEIYALDPKSQRLPLLLARVVNIAESKYLNNPQKGYNDFFQGNYEMKKKDEEEENTYYYSKDRVDSAAQHSLLLFVKKVINEKKAARLYVWQLAFAHLSLMNNDLAASSSMLQDTDFSRSDSLVMGQAEILKGIIAVRKIRITAKEDEASVYAHIKKIDRFSQPVLRKDNAIRYMLSVLSTRYAAKNDSLKKELAYPQGGPYYTSSAHTSQMIAFMNRKDKSLFEKFMADRYPLTLGDLYNIKAVNLLYEYEFAAAAREFSAAKDGTELPANPFNIHIVDCHDCDFASPQKTKYTRFLFIKKMLELKAKGDAATDPEERAQNYFLFANGLYNMTWYGNSRVLRVTRISEDGFYNMTTSPYLRETAFFDCNLALNYYQKAQGLTMNREFQAKLAWMLAKCEHNIWLEAHQESDKDFIAGKYFSELKARYADTRYYADVLQECGYFCTYITRSDSCKRNR